MDATLDGIATSNNKYRGTSIVSPDITDKELNATMPAAFVPFDSTS
jgi:hypothetical protein